MGDCARAPFGPLPVGMVTVCDVAMLPVPLRVASEAVSVRSITPARRQRDATAPIFANVSDDSMLLLQPCVDLCEAFARACGRRAEISEAGVMQRLLSAEVTVQLNFGIPAAVEWADSFVFPPEVWAKNRESLIRHVRDSLLMELATYGMVVVEPPSFIPCSSPSVFRRSYLAVSTTVDKLFYKQWLIGSMLIIPTNYEHGSRDSRDPFRKFKLGGEVRRTSG